jgi:hypothetical protein
MLRHALLGHQRSAVHRRGRKLDATARVSVRERRSCTPPRAQAPSEKSVAMLYSDDVRVTGARSSRRGSHFYTRHANNAISTSSCRAERLKDVPPRTSAFAEHVTVRASSRCLGQGMIHAQLSVMRQSARGRDGQPQATGIHLGAFGWLEDASARQSGRTYGCLRPRGFLRATACRW